MQWHRCLVSSTNQSPQESDQQLHTDPWFLPYASRCVGLDMFSVHGYVRLGSTLAYHCVRLGSALMGTGHYKRSCARLHSATLERCVRLCSARAGYWIQLWLGCTAVATSLNA